jgi:hypothetical protein
MQALEIGSKRTLARVHGTGMEHEPPRLELLSARHASTRWKGSEMPTPQAFLAYRETVRSAFCDGPTRRIGVIITRFRLIVLVFIDRS